MSAPVDGVSLHTSCSVKVLEFADFGKGLPDNEGELTFEAECRVGDFAIAVLEIARKALSGGGVENYEWGNWPFPLRAFRALAEEMPTGSSQH